MLALSLYLVFGGYALFLLGLAVFMHFENRKFGDNQFTMKLLPPPNRAVSAGALEASISAAFPEEDRPVSDWTPVPARIGKRTAPVPSERLSRAA